jgi:hypothetical protein
MDFIKIIVKHEITSEILYMTTSNRKNVCDASDVIRDILESLDTEDLVMTVTCQKSADAIEWILAHSLKECQSFKESFETIIPFEVMSNVIRKFKFKCMDKFLEYWLAKYELRHYEHIADLYFEVVGASIWELPTDQDWQDCMIDWWSNVLTKIQSPFSSDDDDFETIYTNMTHNLLFQVINDRTSLLYCQDLDAVFLYYWFQKHNTFDSELARCIDITYLSSVCRQWWITYLQSKDIELVIELLKPLVIECPNYSYDSIASTGDFCLTKKELRNAMIKGHEFDHMVIADEQGVPMWRFTINDISQDLESDYVPCFKFVEPLFHGYDVVTGWIKYDCGPYSRSVEYKPGCSLGLYEHHQCGSRPMDSVFFKRVLRDKRIKDTDKIKISYNLIILNGVNS